MRQDEAEVIGVQALGWIAAKDDLLDVFMGSSGVGLDMIRENAQDPEFLSSVLDFLCLDDAWVTEFCESHDLPTDRPMRARQALPGGQQVHWT
ncbi:DUF3572 domain-containing protein [Tranquillimonas rosea]|uniref:DUF3572 domain-containing protein n=1 Tax=Tranquillimonas rosea TaxID=641238 RepID=UPI003BACDBDE